MTPELADLPPSAKLVYRVLKDDAPLTQQAICEYSQLPPRTARHALDRLESGDLIESRPNPTDARQSLYEPTDQ
jgi:DNA-binding MarR family transcriptional regulator